MLALPCYVSVISFISFISAVSVMSDLLYLLYLLYLFYLLNLQPPPAHNAWLQAVPILAQSVMTGPHRKYNQEFMN